MSADNKRNTQELVSLNRPASATWRVMVVDDERDNLEVITRLLQFLGSTVITAENGVEALKKLQTEKPTFILSDLLMPEWTVGNYSRVFAKMPPPPGFRSSPLQPPR